MKFSEIKYRSRATFLHFCLSALIFFTTIMILIYFYFPSPHFKINGGWQGLRIMLIIDLILGPLLTFLIFAPKKPKSEKAKDLSIIFIIQIMAFFYGFYTVYQQRPILLVLYPGAIVESLPNKIIQEDIPNINLSELTSFKNIPIAAYIPEQRDNNYGIVRATEKIENMTRYQLGVIKGLTESQIEAFEEIQSNHSEPLYIIRLVGSYKTQWLVVNKELHEFGFLGEFDTIPLNEDDHIY